MFLTRPNVVNLLPKSSTLAKDKIGATLFSTTCKQLNNDKILSRRKGIFSQSPAKFLTCRAEEETAHAEGVGWAGQPIVKRLHTILPEVHGDASDILKVTKKSKSILEIGNNLDIKVRNFGRSHDIIAAINANAKIKNVNKSEVKELKRRVLHAKSEKQLLENSGILTRNPAKVKRRKRTVVLATKPAPIPSPPKRKLHKRRNTRIVFNGLGIRPTMTMNRRRLHTMPSSRPLFNIINRQFQTDSALNAAKSAFLKQSKSSKTPVPPYIPEEDCVCPEILYTTGKRKSTKICGEAKGLKKGKKKSSWKQKMCLVEPPEELERKRTLVCISEAAKLGKRKKELPKCPPKEIKIAPRVIICAPNLIDEEEAKKAKKECVKIEEVKIRKRTKVCKPVILFAKEEIGIKAEKKVCISTKMKRVVSRHTKICPP